MVKRFSPKTLIGLGVIIICGIVYFNTIDNTRHDVSPNVSLSYVPSSNNNRDDQCRLSLAESEGWFCDLDEDWLRRKRLHHIQDKRNRFSDKRHVFFQNNWEPTIHCRFERRLGNMGDGGKWICDPHRIKEANSTVLVYSIGSSGNYWFEEAIRAEMPTAEIHTFDIISYGCPINVCTFHLARLGNGKHDNSKTIEMIIKELGHQNKRIDILKIDIEGDEFELFDEFFKSRTTPLPYIRQILVEIHLSEDGNVTSSRNTHNLFELFRMNNYAIFHKEPNLNNHENVCEYSLIRLDPAFFVSPSS